ncbi:ComF family protein [Salinimicrobium oceani]|uniref:ComF family protein n=1 Tax=Salinimicrobium oceani TaxID=2722702 RepID=A0ABX1D1A4_9FLAO|nr:phosphoribosyltransferase family protein [Salinimicrobium oceani]NJW52929.1 ComF family protein [Salinimicrobium oceani]
MFHDFLDLVFPRICHACDTALHSKEEILCTSCLHELPLAQHHLDNSNEIEKIFYGRIPVENATSLLLFEKKGLAQKLIHNLKYRGYEEIGTYFGQWLGNEIKEIPKWQQISAVVPVPIHKQKFRKRGYNQVTRFGMEIAAALEVPYIDDVLLKITATQTQTVKKRLARWGSFDETMVISNSEKLKDRHVLLVDDLVTTGATLEVCAQKLLKIEGVKISIATIAVTH